MQALDRVDRINSEALEVQPGRVLLTLLAALFYGLGWLAAKVCLVVWLALAWTATAIKLGWQDAFRSRRRIAA